MSGWSLPRLAARMTVVDREMAEMHRQIGVMLVRIENLQKAIDRLVAVRKGNGNG